MRVGGFDASLTYCMDWDLWIRFMKSGARFVRIGDYLWAQRQWPGSKTQRNLAASELEIQQLEIQGMLASNGFTVTQRGKMLNRIWRMLNGNYAREMVDGFQLRGRCASLKA